jgi:hypothetical protein
MGDKVFVLFPVDFAAVFVFFSEDGFDFSIVSVHGEILVANGVFMLAFDIHGCVFKKVRVRDNFGGVVAAVTDFGFLSADVEDQ